MAEEQVVYEYPKTHSGIGYLEKGSCGKWFTGYLNPYSESTPCWDINDPGRG